MEIHRYYQEGLAGRFAPPSGSFQWKSPVNPPMKSGQSDLQPSLSSNLEKRCVEVQVQLDNYSTTQTNIIHKDHCSIQYIS